MGRGKIKVLFRSLFKRKKKDYVPVYLSRFETIDKMIRCRLIGIDIKEAYAVIDVSVHLLYHDDDRKYAAFFETLRAFINYYRGNLDIPMLEYDERINFCVNFKHEIRFDLDREEFYEKPKEENIPWLVGFYQSGKVVYDVYEKKEPGEK